MRISSSTALIGEPASPIAYRHPVTHPDDIRAGKATGEKRSAQRYKIAIPALLETKSGDVERITVTNISLAGFACESRQYYPVGTRCWLRLPSMPQMPHFSMMEASVVRLGDDVMGCAFSYMLHPDELDPYIDQYRVES